MRRYIEHIKQTRAPHERRTHAMQVAGVLTAAVFAVWLGTLSLRLGSGDAVAQDDGSSTLIGSAPDAAQTSLSASAAQSSQDGKARLEVSTTSVYSN